MNPIVYTSSAYPPIYLLHQSYISTSQTETRTTDQQTESCKHTEKKKHKKRQRAIYRDRFTKTSIPIKVRYIPYKIKTKEHRKALLAIQHQSLSKSERIKHLKTLDDALSKNQKQNLARTNKLKVDASTNRILYIIQENCDAQSITPDPETIWTDIFISQKDAPKPEIPTGKPYRDVLRYKDRLCDLLSPNFLTQFHKIESFTLTRLEYLPLKLHVQEVTKGQDTYMRNLFFPNTVALNNIIKGERMSVVPQPYLLAAKAHIQITQPYKKARVLTFEERKIADKLSNGCCSSLNELEKSITTLQQQMCQFSLLCLIHKAVARMEKEGVLPVPPQDFNDPYIIEAYETRYAASKELKSTKTSTLKDQPIEKIKYEKTQNTETQTTSRTGSEPSTDIPRSSDWTERSQEEQRKEPDSEDVRQAAMALLLLSSSFMTE